MPDNAQSPDGSTLFAAGARFVTGVVSTSNMPETGQPEIAIAGRSNAGKSTLVNALTGRRKLAHASKTPGRTRQLNYYDIAGRLFLVDLPGFGYARAPKTQIHAWRKLIDEYLRGRPELRRILFLIDARRGVGAKDRLEMTGLDQTAAAWQIVLTKMDKLNAEERRQALLDATDIARSHPAAHPTPIAVSARKGTGMERLRDEIAMAAGYTAPD